MHNIGQKQLACRMETVRITHRLVTRGSEPVDDTPVRRQKSAFAAERKKVFEHAVKLKSFRLTHSLLLNEVVINHTALAQA